MHSLQDVRESESDVDRKEVVSGSKPESTSIEHRGFTVEVLGAVFDNNRGVRDKLRRDRNDSSSELT